MTSFKLIFAIFVLSIARVHSGGLPLASVLSAAPVYASSPLLARSFYSSPLLAPEALAASAPAIVRAAPLPVLARAAPLLAPATVGYAHSVPQNIPPYASQVNIVNRALSGYASAQYLSPNVAPAFLRSPLAYSVAPGFSSLPVLRTGVTAPYALRTAAPLPLSVAPLSYSATPLGYSTAPFAYSAGVQPLQTQAIFRSIYPGVAPVGVGARVAPVGVPVGIAPVGAAADATPIDDDTQEIIPESEEDPTVVAARTNDSDPALNGENPTEFSTSSADIPRDNTPDRQTASEPIASSK